MNILLSVIYDTDFGEELVLNVVDGGAEEPAGRQEGRKRVTRYRMRTSDGHEWTCGIKPDWRPGKHIDYYYSVVRGESNVVKSEWTVIAHRLEMSTKADEMVVHDRWMNLPEDSYQYSSAFTDCLKRRPLSKVPLTDYKVTVRLKVRAPQLGSHQRMAIVGGDRAFGAWNVSNGLRMYEHNYNEWVADIDATRLQSGTFEFKFVAVNVHDNNDIMWEDGYNRTLKLPPIAEGNVFVYEMGTAFFPICNLRLAGTLVPVFSLRSRTSFGVGDFGDLVKMIDWVAETKQRVLQLLPINDTTKTRTWADSYPYSCISVFALHPQYADLTALPPLADEQKRRRYEKTRQELNALKQIDYERVNKAKTEYLRDLYAQEGQKTLSSPEFKRFFKENSHWLTPYAQYCFLRDENGTADFSQWKDHKVFDENDRPALENPRTQAYKQVAFSYYVQFILSVQMANARDHARQKGVILKGDIPIGVNRLACDVWQEPRYFNLNGQAGAPPDDFSTNGQNWGFPTYDWPEMLKDGCRWWIDRFSNMARYFDAYRIDHVLGFFRIWEIPIDAVHGLIGQFSPALGMTREEIEAYGLKFQERLFTEPFITDWVVDRFFGERAQMVRDNYLTASENGHYHMRPEFDTQRKIEAAFEGKNDKRDTDLRDGLYALVSDVLFVRDHHDANKFHPRISVQFDCVYEALSDSDKHVFNNLYNDYYYRRNNQFWYREAMSKLPKLVEATRMLVCAEDLGMVPDCVDWVMNELRILSLKIQSMPREYGVRFGNLSQNPYRSVCTISSHDTPTLRQWWDEDRNRTQEYFNSALQKYGPAPHPLPGWLARDIILRNLMCPSMLCVLSIQDWLSIDEGIRLADADAERINIPANPKHYWRYRMHVDIEDLQANNEYKQNVTDLIRESGRM